MKRILVLAFVLAFVLVACASRPDYPVEEPLPQVATRNYGKPPATASLWNQDPQSLFGNRRAREVGDILTVIVSVDDEAEMQNSMDATRTNEEDFSVNALFGLPEWANGVLPLGARVDPAVALSRSKAAQGSGSIARQEKVTLELAAVVVDQLPNGHLVIEGTQRIRVNAETRDLKVSGVVRPEDITRDNTISHEKIASADIVYSGHGQVAGTTKPKVGSRLLDILVPF
ncbi:flagellar basal body L-ring protein FlgH [Parvularcula dongshanensis]|uniref:Flagellar L-ring protein n=1 Tax=Parvularcula dongshanensis TaxID=1173995 RepID=A0A840I5G5_9PROT|nr:flagellar basal body L-ring protein FlgH [Parvularcula dongshanensis]MBB4659632.1 flagellar L-ring protein precursor FlgH [Parvularcula dongshanensis]